MLSYEINQYGGDISEGKYLKYFIVFFFTIRTVNIPGIPSLKDALSAT